MATVSGQLTIGTTGNLSYNIGMVPDEIDFYGLQCVGHGDSSNQFVFNSRGNGQYFSDRCIRIYNSSGTLVVNASFVGMSGTNLVLNATTANPSFPIQIVARNAS